MDFEDGIWRHEPDLGLTFVWPLAEQATKIGVFSVHDELLFSWSIPLEEAIGDTIEEQIETMVQAVKREGLSSVIGMLSEQGEES